jgi:heme-degrading monooxygenase HmoA
MSSIVAIHQQVWQDHLEELLATIGSSLGVSRALHPERRGTRVFQRLGEPTQLLSLSEWASADAFERFRHWPVFVETVARCGPPPRIVPLVPLLRFERVARRVGVAACATITVAVENGLAIEEYLLSDTHRQVTGSPGLVSRELYRAADRNGELLLVHSWRSLEDLEAYRALHSQQGEADLIRRGARVERFTGSLAAEYSIHGIESR